VVVGGGEREVQEGGGVLVFVEGSAKKREKSAFNLISSKIEKGCASTY